MRMPEMLDNVSKAVKDDLACSILEKRNIRQFYLAYTPLIKRYTLSSVFNVNTQKGQTLSDKFGLVWSHCQILTRIENGGGGE